ncbi:MAG: alpha-ketoglutarate-dependent dioxygenase AlkB [Pseudomonadota bacterium]|nr:alpha-ketoglutarate-dependent dioxygenase AlkB [Pseudomonadota bacterium]
MSVNSTLAHLEQASAVIELDHGARLWRFHRVLGAPAEALFHTLCNELPWERPTVRVFGRAHAVPRQTCWIADAGTHYRYSGLHHRGQGWPEVLAPLRQRLRCLTGRDPNGVLGNLYRDGDDTMGWHRDNEPELGPAPWVLSYNLGAERDFALRRYGEHRQSDLITLGHDELLVMSPEVQRHYEHARPRRRRVTAPRLNLTFREIVTGR